MAFARPSWILGSTDITGCTLGHAWRDHIALRRSERSPRAIAIRRTPRQCSVVQLPLSFNSSCTMEHGREGEARDAGREKLGGTWAR